ncbi:MAG: OmpA family protein [Turneriella sp.]|nr:OmpA family protein [Turneriella sp.]
MRRILWPAMLVVANFVVEELLAESREDILSRINTAAHEFAPTFTPDGKTMVFSSNRNGYSDLYISHWKEGVWEKPQPLTAVNSPFNDETPFLSHDGQILLFASDRDGSIELPRDQQGQVRVSFDIYMARWDGRTWSRPQPVREANTQWNEKSPSLSRDGRYLFFSSWPFGDMKRSRIRMLDLKAESNALTDLPPQINSGNQETAFVPGEDATRYYFASRRPGGKGGWDIWQTRWLDGVWQEPEPVPGNINTEGNEAFLAFARGSYYISTTLNPAKKDYDIRCEPMPRRWEIELVDADTRQPVSGSIRLRLDEDGKTVFEKSTPKPTAQFVVELPALDNASVHIAASADGYLPATEVAELASTNTGKWVLPLRKITPNASFHVQSIHFDFDSAQLRQSSEPVLYMVLDFLQKNPQARFEIIGHTDLSGDDDYNLKLSEKRAESVKAWLVEHGIAAERLTTSGAGKSRPLVARRGKPYDEKNRRTEFRLLGTP